MVRPPADAQSLPGDIAGVNPTQEKRSSQPISRGRRLFQGVCPEHRVDNLFAGTPCERRPSKMGVSVGPGRPCDRYPYRASSRRGTWKKRSTLRERGATDDPEFPNLAEFRNPVRNKPSLPRLHMRAPPSKGTGKTSTLCAKILRHRGILTSEQFERVRSCRTMDGRVNRSKHVHD